MEIEDMADVSVVRLWWLSGMVTEYLSLECTICYQAWPIKRKLEPIERIKKHGTVQGTRVGTVQHFFIKYKVLSSEKEEWIGLETLFR